MTKTNETKIPLARRLTSLLGSQTFFRLIMALLVAQAAWIALSGRYPMAFDEDFHLGIIRLYAHHLSPFWSGQPANADAFGAVARDPSYMYHYLMSFPYRLISLFTNDQTIQVIILRAIDIGLFAGGLALYRRLMLKLGISRAVTHVCLLIFVLIPIVPLLAAQINYDNLLLPLTAAALLLTVRFDDILTSRKRLDARTSLQILVICLLGSLVKYAFLPIFAAIVGFGLIRAWQYRRQIKPWAGLAASWRELSRWLRLSLAAAFILSAGLFTQRYGVNLVRYHNPIPDCAQVLTVKQCSAYGPWNRDYNYELTKTQSPRSPLIFTADWFYGMWLRLFFAVDGPGTGFQTRGPLLVPGLSSIVFSAIGVLAVLAALPRLAKRFKARLPIAWLFVAVAAVYTLALWLDEYRDFLATGRAVAINGRYLLPVLLLVMPIAAVAVSELVRNRQSLKLGLAVVFILCFAWGGGALTYILRSNNNWYWPSPAVRTANQDVRDVLGPLTPGYDHQTQFMH
jgi:hypothetical protein